MPPRPEDPAHLTRARACPRIYRVLLDLSVGDVPGLERCLVRLDPPRAPYRKRRRRDRSGVSSRGARRGGARPPPRVTVAGLLAFPPTFPRPFLLEPRSAPF